MTPSDALRTDSANGLAPRDLDRALRRMKAELAIVELHRRLLDPSLDARTVLELAERIQALHAQR